MHNIFALEAIHKVNDHPAPLLPRNRPAVNGVAYLDEPHVVTVDI
jgi:hypothetical protein